MRCCFLVNCLPSWTVFRLSPSFSAWCFSSLKRRKKLKAKWEALPSNKGTVLSGHAASTCCGIFTGSLALHDIFFHVLAAHQTSGQQLFFSVHVLFRPLFSPASALPSHLLSREYWEGQKAAPPTWASGLLCCVFACLPGSCAAFVSWHPVLFLSLLTEEGRGVLLYSQGIQPVPTPPLFCCTCFNPSFPLPKALPISILFVCSFLLGCQQ